MPVYDFPRREAPKPRTVFVLGGGGNLGAVQVGMLRALLERNIVPDEVVGCSVGAINGAGLAADPTLEGVDRLEDIWRNLRGDAILPAGRLSGLWLLTRKYRSLEPNDGLRRLIEQLPLRTFEEMTVPLHVVATSLRTGGERWFATGPFVEPILASAALPAVYPPVTVDGELLIDGAVVNNVPISKALALRADRVIVLHVGNFERPRREPKRPLDALLQSFSIARNYRFRSEVDNPPEGVTVEVLPAIDPGNLKQNDFSKSPQLIARAYRSTAAYLDGELAAAASN